jgi:uncharacterized protein YbaP (TraB family)
MQNAKTFTRCEALIALSAIAASSCVPELARASAVDYPLWEVRKGRGTVYLLGHTPPRLKTWSDARIERLLRTCGVLWTETQHKDEPPTQTMIKQYMLDPRVPLEERLNVADRARLKAAAKAAGVPLSSLNALRPWAAGEDLEGTFFEQVGQTQNAAEVLYARATAAGIPTSSEFATGVDTLRWFATLTVEQQVEYLQYIMDEVLQGTAIGQRTYEAWAAGDATRANAWVTRMKARYPEVYPSLVLDRNRDWVSRINTMVQSSKPSMVVVGLYHLCGPDRLQNMLQESGLKVNSV